MFAWGSAANEFIWHLDLEAQGHLCLTSSSSSQIIRHTQSATVGVLAFPVTASMSGMPRNISTVPPSFLQLSSRSFPSTFV